MTEAERNLENRKIKPLSKSEWLTYFFFPLKSESYIGSKTKSLNEIEDERFKKFSFDKKRKESANAQGYGCLFYLFIFLTLIIIKIIY